MLKLPFAGYKEYNPMENNVYTDVKPFLGISPDVETRKRRIVLLGATGSIGRSTLQVIRMHSSRLELVGIAADQSARELDDIADEFKVSHSVLFSREGIEGLIRLATLPEADIVLVATTGTIALRVTLAALSAGKDVALANKETMVVGGHLVTAAAKAFGRRVFPVDSEHNAIFQCLEGNTDHGSVRRLLLTASGGPFRNTPAEQLEYVTVEDALRHPNWSMGRKITVDCATMANKGLEMMEARWLFNVEPEKIDVVIHPQSVVHSMVEFIDNSILAQMSTPSMTFAIQHILMYPERIEGVHDSLDFSKLFTLEFQPPDMKKFPCLQLAYDSLYAGGLYPVAYNAANEAAVDAFLNKGLPFTAIPEIISHVLDCNLNYRLPDNIDDLMDAEAEAGSEAEKCLRSYIRL